MTAVQTTNAAAAKRPPSGISSEQDRREPILLCAAS
jgi:hypothetical protein